MATAQILNNEAVIFEDNIYIKAKNFWTRVRNIRN